MIGKMTIDELLKTLPEADQKVWYEAVWEFGRSNYYSGSWEGYRNGVADGQNGFINVPAHILGALDWAESWEQWREREEQEQT